MSENTQSDTIINIFTDLKGDTYFNKYGMDIVFTVITLFIIGFIFMYIKVQGNKNYYIYGKYTDKDGKRQSIWSREKCKPHILPFSGNLYQPDPTKTVFETTMNNFEECVKNPFAESNLEMLNPFSLVANK